MLILLRINLNYNLFGVPYNEDKLARKKNSPVSNYQLLVNHWLCQIHEISLILYFVFLNYFGQHGS